MTRDEFEAVAWQNAAWLSSLDPVKRSAAMDNLLTAADAYAATTLGEIDGYRRQRKAAVHWHEPDGTVPACGRRYSTGRPDLTRDPDRVTCWHCKRCWPFKSAARDMEMAR